MKCAQKGVVCLGTFCTSDSGDLPFLTDGFKVDLLSFAIGLLMSEKKNESSSAKLEGGVGGRTKL